MSHDDTGSGTLVYVRASKATWVCAAQLMLHCNLKEMVTVSLSKTYMRGVSPDTFLLMRGSWWATPSQCSHSGSTRTSGDDAAMRVTCKTADGVA
jgi:hypothetical protein